MQGALGFGLLPIGMDASDVGLSLVGRIARVGASRWFAGCWSSSREQDVRVDDGRSRGPFLWPIRHLNMAAGPGSRSDVTGPPPLVDWSVSREYPRSTNRVPASRSRTRHASSNCQVLFSSTDAISFHAVSGGLRVRIGLPGWPPHSSQHISRPLAPYSVMQRPLTSS